MFIRVDRILSLLLVLGCIGAAGLRAAREYAPRVAEPFTETWRWSSIKELDGKGLYCMEPAPDASMWFGHEHGLARYDGMNWQWFGAAEGLPDEAVLCVRVALDGTVYALSEYSFSCYDGESWSVLFRTHYHHTVAGSRIVEDSDGVIWVGTLEGIVRVESGTVEYPQEVLFPITSNLIDNDGDLWLLERDTMIAYEIPLREGQLAARDEWTLHRTLDTKDQRARNGALCLMDDGSIWTANDNVDVAPKSFDPDTRTWTPHDLESIGATNINYKVSKSSDGTVWIASVHELAWRRPNGAWSRTDKDELPSLSSQAYLCSDVAGNLWIGGINEFPYRISYRGDEWITYEDLVFQCDQEDGRHWFITRDYKVVSYSKSSDEWISYGVEDGVVEMPVAMLTTKAGLVVVAGSHDGAAAVSCLFDGQWKRFVYPEFGVGINFRSLFEMADGNLLLGHGLNDYQSVGKQAGLLRLNIDGTRVSSVVYSGQISTGSIPKFPYRIAGIVETAPNELWLSGRSLFRFDGWNATAFKEDSWASETWLDNIVIGPDRSVWVAKWGFGLYRIQGDEVTQYTVADGLASNETIGMATDQRGLFWLVTSKGFSCFDGVRWQSHTIHLPVVYKRGGVLLKFARDGAMWQSHVDPLWFESFDPNVNRDGKEFETIKTVRYHPDREGPDTRITLYDDRVPESGNVYVEWEGEDAWQKTGSEDLLFSYRIDDGDWSPFERGGQRAFAGLASGPHSFSVRARDIDFNVDATPAAVSFEVVPPLWKRAWFVVLMSVFALSVIALVITIIRIRIKHLVEMEEVKLQFFTNISHELRTPLTVILGPIERLLRSAETPDTKLQLSLAHRNARKMLNLVNQLLDFRKLEFGKVKLTPSKADLVAFSKDILASHRPLAEESQQQLAFSSPIDSLWAAFDQDSLQKILDNLLSNAIKYTPEGGSVRLGLEKGGPAIDGYDFTARFWVEDDGVGVPKESQRHVFDAFYRVDETQSFAGGNGIGLSLAKELVTLSQGSIRLTSPRPGRENKEFPGARFDVHIPMTEEPAPRSPESLPVLAEQVAEEQEYQEVADRPVLLLVDDSEDIRIYLKSELEPEYEVLVAENGEQGLALAMERLPDVAILDVMMPVMDGLELCQRLKSDEITSHIPVIMLTARRSDSHQLEGLESGADDYVVKPAQTPILKARVSNLLENRKRLQEHYSKLDASEPISGEPSANGTTSGKVDPNERFLARAREVMNEHLSDTEFKPADLGRLLHMSESTLYRKFKAVTNQAPGAFIRAVRLNRAAAELLAGERSVSEISYLVGFKELSYFSVSFKKQYGCSPRDYASATSKLG